MAPEYYYRGEVSTKSDIFSLGILIIEITTWLKVDSNREDISSKNLINDVRQIYLIPLGILLTKPFGLNFQWCN